MVNSDRIIDLYEIDFQYNFKIDYSYGGNCELYGCDREGICRCGTIDDARIADDIDMTMVTDMVYDYIFKTNDISVRRDIFIDSILDDFNINKYFINRILSLHKMYDKSNWNIEIIDGYYGEELSIVSLEERLGDISKSMSNIFLDNKSKIEYLLKKEYGYIDHRLIGKKWDLDIINKSDIIFGQKEHYNNVSEGLYYYSDTSYDNELPRGILLKDGNKYRVIDGYHRIKNTRENFVIAIIAV